MTQQNEHQIRAICMDAAIRLYPTGSSADVIVKEAEILRSFVMGSDKAADEQQKVIVNG